MSTDNIRVVYGLVVKGAEIGAVIWIITIPQTYNHRGIFNILLVLHCCCALLFSAAAIAFFIKYRRSKRNKMCIRDRYTIDSCISCIEKGFAKGTFEVLFLYPFLGSNSI